MAVAGASPAVGTVPGSSPCPGRLAEPALAAGGLLGSGVSSQSLRVPALLLLTCCSRRDTQPCSHGARRAAVPAPSRWHTWASHPILWGVASSLPTPLSYRGGAPRVPPSAQAKVAPREAHTDGAVARVAGGGGW